MKHLPGLAVVALIAVVVVAMAASGDSCVVVADEAVSKKDVATPDVTTLPERAKTVAAAGVTLDVARDRAEVMHDVYAATLEVMHERYFHGSRAAVPARAMQDVFATMQRKSKAEARWISVNMEPMSIDHAPRSDFEKRAAQAISDGKGYLEEVEEGVYRRAGPIPLDDGCIGCHAGFSKKPTDAPKFAGLVISIPLRKDGAKQLQTPDDRPREE